MNNPVTKYCDLEVWEWPSGFGVMHTPTGKTHWMSDMVDQYTDRSGRPIRVGTRAFYSALKNDLKTNYSDWLQAYFDLAE